jgi:hypothetical protein
VERLRIRAKPSAGVVSEDLVVLLSDHCLEVWQGRDLAKVGDARSAFAALDHLEAGILGRALELEAVDDVPALQHFDLVVNSILGLVFRAPGLQGRNLDELALAQETSEEVSYQRRRLGGAARLRERDLAGRLGQLDLPDAEAVLDATPQGDARPDETTVGGVVVRGGENAAQAAKSYGLAEKKGNPPSGLLDETHR